MNHDARIERIREKLTRASELDPDRKVFGARAHDYVVGAPVSEEQLAAFEREYSVSLPEGYRAFLKGVGNGGPSYENSAAGPYFGIYPLGHSVDELEEDPRPFLKRPAVLDPEMTSERWSHLTRRVGGPAEIADPDDGSEREEVFGGLLPIGSQGCTYLHALVLNGPHRGRVVNIDLQNRPQPKFAPHRDFLDWYEGWLDEVISGALLRKGPTWFGYDRTDDEGA